MPMDTWKIHVFPFLLRYILGRYSLLGWRDHNQLIDDDLVGVIAVPHTR